MAQDNIPKNQVKSRNSIEQREHEDDAAARRVTPVDFDGDAFGTPGNPIFVNTSTAAGHTDPEIFNVDAILADTEYSQVLPDNTRALLVRVRDGDARMQLSFEPGGSSSTFMTVGMGNNFSVYDVELIGKTIYFQLSKPSKIVEILTWV